MDLPLRECARLLALPENDVRRLVRKGRLPAFRLHDKYRVGRVDLLEWALRERRRVSPKLFPGPDGGDAPDLLRAALSRGGLASLPTGGWEGIAAIESVPASLRDVASRPDGFCLARDAIAIPHPRRPLVGAVDAPRLAVGFADPPLEMASAEVRILFVLVCPSVRPHVEVLTRLAYALHDEPWVALLRAKAPWDAILTRLEEVERAGLESGRMSVVA